jgi:hypothetical protein
MKGDNVIPFPKRRPSNGELEAYRQITRNWSAEVRHLIFPEHYRHADAPPPPPPRRRGK